MGEKVAKNLGKLRERRIKQWILEKRLGYTLRDYGLDTVSRHGSTVETSFQGSWVKSSHWDGSWWPKLIGAGEIGVPRWEETPEENSRMIRSVLRHFGADQVGFVELDKHTRKLIYSFDARDGKAIEFENVDLAYETPHKRVIPNRVGWFIVFTIQLSGELIKRHAGKAPTALSSAATGLAYGRSSFIIDKLQTFLHVLGYQGFMGTWFNGLAIAPTLGVLSGLGELSRLNKMLSPEYGPLQRIFKLATDLHYMSILSI